MFLAYDAGAVRSSVETRVLGDYAVEPGVDLGAGGYVELVG